MGFRLVPKSVTFDDLVVYHLWRYSQGITPSEGVEVKRPLVASESLTYNQP